MVDAGELIIAWWRMDNYEQSFATQQDLPGLQQGLQLASQMETALGHGRVLF